MFITYSQKYFFNKCFAVLYKFFKCIFISYLKQVVSKTTFESWDDEEYSPGISEISRTHGSFWKKVLIDILLSSLQSLNIFVEYIDTNTP